MKTINTAREPQELLAQQIQFAYDEAKMHEKGLSLAFNICESPLEQVFLLEYIALYGAQPAWTEQDSHSFYHTMQPHYGERSKSYEVIIDPQHEITCGARNYRADFLVSIKTFGQDWRIVQEIVVEVDGHDFHERTKEQAARDRSRDRAMTNSGYKVLRFTGSEIYRNPLAAVFELSDAISGACRDQGGA